MTPYEVFYEKKLDVSYLRTLGSLCFVHVPKETRLGRPTSGDLIGGKMASYTNLGVLVGYTETTRMVRVWNPIKHTVKNIRDVVIDESRK